MRRAVDLAAPDQELALILQPALQGRPRLKQDFMRDLSDGFAVLLAGDKQAPVRPRQQLNQRPFGIGGGSFARLGIPLPARADRLALARHVRETAA